MSTRETSLAVHSLFLFGHDKIRFSLHLSCGFTVTQPAGPSCQLSLRHASRQTASTQHTSNEKRWNIWCLGPRDVVAAVISPPSPLTILDCVKVAILHNLAVLTEPHHLSSSWWACRPHLAITTMCTYVFLIPACHHRPLLLFDTSCRLILGKFQRINHRAAWEDSVLSEILFDVPEPCNPGAENIRPVYTSDTCRWDCRYIKYIASSNEF
ncbi:hypothetical protein LZ31DRAFT_66872 [Colletotrichum somersetense]|nr:hypothetical protein LZ31DRAFT_66872 [Colletotrichum somersetense]